MEEEEKKESEEHPRKKSNFTEKIRENPWMLSSFVLGILVIILLFTTFSGGLTGNVTKEKAGQITLDFLNSYVVKDGGLSLDSVDENLQTGTYIVSVNSNGNSVPISLSKDGKYIDFGAGVINIDDYIKYLSTKPSSSQTDTCWLSIAENLGMNAQEIESFAFSSEGISLLKADDSLTGKYSITGSPTMLINSVKSNSVYSGTDAMKQAICSAFNTVPSECSGVQINSTLGIPKTNKPIVELFVMSYCPYGVLAENNLLPLVGFFGDKVDFKIRFIANVGGDTISSVQSLHGAKEAQEDARQIAIMNLYPEKYWDYLKSFNEDCYGSSSTSSSSSGSCN